MVLEMEWNERSKVRMADKYDLRVREDMGVIVDSFWR